MSLTLTLELYGSAELSDAQDNPLWSTMSDETALAMFGEFIDEEQIDDLIDYLTQEGFITDSDTVEVVVEIPEDDDSGETYMIPAGA